MGGEPRPSEHSRALSSFASNRDGDLFSEFRAQGVTKKEIKQ
jgi:hypothetical protein